MTESQQTRLRHLKMQVLRKLQGCLQQAEAHFNRPFPMPKISYYIKGQSAGMAVLMKNELKFNRTLLLENAEAFIAEVVPHELAHLVVFWTHGHANPHGKEWKSVMQQVFGVQPETYHNFDIKNVAGKTFLYHCSCRKHHLTIRRHNRIQRRQTEYYCKQCKGKLVFEPENDETATDLCYI